MTTLSFQGLGWEFKLHKKRSSYFIYLPKILIRGHLLNKGDIIKCFTVKTNNIEGIFIPLEQKRIEKIIVETNNYLTYNTEEKTPT